MGVIIAGGVAGEAGLCLPWSPLGPYWNLIWWLVAKKTPSKLFLFYFLNTIKLSRSSWNIIFKFAPFIQLVLSLLGITIVHIDPLCWDLIWIVLVPVIFNEQLREMQHVPPSSTRPKAFIIIPACIRIQPLYLWIFNTFAAYMWVIRNQVYSFWF